MTNLYGFDIAYSYGQQAYLANLLFHELGVQGPIVWFSVDTQCSVGIHYAADSAHYPYPDLTLSKLCFVDSSPQGVVNSNPCSLAYTTTTVAAGLIDLYITSSCEALELLLIDSFITPSCIEYQQVLYKEAIQYSATGSPELFAQLFTLVGTEDVTELMAKISQPVFHFYGLEGNRNPISFPSCVITAVPYCLACPGLNPAIPGTCVCAGQTLIQPFPNFSRFVTVAGQDTSPHLGNFRFVLRHLKAFLNGSDMACHPCPLDFKIPTVCP